MTPGPALVVVGVLAFVALHGAARGAPHPTAEVGLPQLRHYGPRSYGAEPQNWAVVQDRRGLLYVGNNDCVLEYDGARWRRIATPDDTIARSLALGPHGAVYVGCVGDFGILAPDEQGALAYRSLVDALPPADREFSDVWKTHRVGRHVVFQASEGLFRWDGSTLRVWKADSPFHVSFVVRDRLFVRQRGVGLLELRDDELRPVPGGARFADERVYALLPMGGPADRRLLVGARTQGLLALDPATGALAPLAGEASDYLVAHQLYDGVRLPDGGFALATLRGGIAFVGPGGDLQSILGESAGLQDRKVVSLFVDRERGLWIGLGHGLARLQLDAPLSVFGKASGLDGRVVDLARHEGSLFAATGQGVYVLRRPASSTERSTFAAIDGITTQAWSLLSTRTGLLVATNDGVYRVRDGRAELISEEAAAALAGDRADPELVLVGRRDGLGLLRRDPTTDTWQGAGVVPGLDGWIHRILQDAEGAFWLSELPAGLHHLRLPEGAAAAAQLTTVTDRLGAGAGFVHTFSVPATALGDGDRHRRGDGDAAAGQGQGDRLVFATRRGLRRHTRSAGEGGAGPIDFAPLGPAGESPWALEVTALGVDSAGNLWVSAGSCGVPEVGVAMRAAEGGFRWSRGRTRQLPFAYTILVEPQPGGDVIWFGGDDAILRYDSHKAGAADVTFRALVRRVHTGREGPPLFVDAEGPGPGTLTLPYERNDLRLDFASVSYEDERLNEYAYRLEGFDEGPERWSLAASKEYTNLPEGAYSFHVVARNASGRTSEEGVLALEVLPPWYRTGWAYGLYALAALLLIAGTVSAWTWRLRRRNRQLEAIVLERTAEIRRQAQEIRATSLENERLLLNILPAPIAARLRDGERTIADSYREVTVLFADVVGFTAMSSRMEAEEVVELLGGLFDVLDDQVAHRGLEKIKTIGDGYMVAGGLPEPRPDHAEATALLALDMLSSLDAFNQRHGTTLSLRVGLHLGPVVAGVIGHRKFIYDLWGDTVNTASRMESSGQPGRVQVSEAVHDALARRFTFTLRGEIDVKGKGKMRTWFLEP